MSTKCFICIKAASSLRYIGYLILVFIAKYRYIGTPLQQYYEYIFRVFVKRAFLQVPTCLVEHKYSSREKKWFTSTAFCAKSAPRKAVDSVYNLPLEGFSSTLYLFLLIGNSIF